MRQATFLFLFLLCSAFAVGQPQWVLLANVSLFNQNQPIPETTLLIPTQPGVFRLNMYVSGGGSGGKGVYTVALSGFDITGFPPVEGRA
jgi:hypothetical protein